jgi:ATP-dependent DNA helicase
MLVAVSTVQRKRRKGGSSEDETDAVPEAEAPAVAATVGPGEDEEDTFSRVINGQNVSDRQPALLSGGVLREYQLKGMEWMVGLWENGLVCGWSVLRGAVGVHATQGH